MIGYIGPIKVDHYDPTVQSTASPSAANLRAVSIGGKLQWSQAQQLQELLDNPARRITVAGKSGVLEYIYCDDDLLGPSRGWYLLDSADWNATQPDSLNGLTGPVGFTLKAFLVGDASTRRVVLSHWARSKANSVGLLASSVVVAPVWTNSPDEAFTVDPGGVPATRDYDSAFPHAGLTATPTPRALPFRSGLSYGEADGLANVILPVISDTRIGTPPRWVSDRGGDVRSYDRRLGREVYGKAHPFTAPTDVLITNGILRFWPGPTGVAPYLNVQAFAGGSWRDIGQLCLETRSDDVLRSARLASLTPETTTVVLSAKHAGDLFVSLNRGERMVRVLHGATRPPTVATQRFVSWRGTPPFLRADPSTSAAGKFGNGISIASGDVTFAWPTAVSKTAWTYCGWWLPSLTSLLQGDSGLWSLMDSAQPVSTVKFNGGTKRIEWTQNGETVQSAALSFSGAQPIFWAIRQGATRMLTTYVQGGSVAHVTSAFTNPGTTDLDYRAFAIGVVSDNWFGAGTYGLNSFGSGTQANGVLDTNMIFDGALSDAEAAALATSSAPFSNLPAPESRLVWFSLFDSLPTLYGSTLANGRRFETQSDGTTRHPDSYGLTKGIGVLDALAFPTAGLGSGFYGRQFAAGAFLATTASQDDLGDHHSQFGADNIQTLRLQ